jgi:hypothetical protein
MVIVLVQAVTADTKRSLVTSISINRYFAMLFMLTPGFALVYAILVNLRLPSIVLIIMGVHALVSHMMVFLERTKNCLKVEHIEVSILLVIF